jgi:hypothetical protein
VSDDQDDDARRAFERTYLNDGHCPDCRCRGFVIGPMAGGSRPGHQPALTVQINIECGNLGCRARFNVAFVAGEALFHQRLPKRSEGGPKWPSEPKDGEGVLPN